MEANTKIKSEIRTVIEQFFHALDTQNLELMERLLPDDPSMVHIGTDRDEIWRGRTELQRATEDQFRNLDYYKASIRDLTVHSTQDGDVAWYFHLLDAEIRSGDNHYSWEGARFTGVLEKRDGRWAMMQTHVSIPESELE